MFVAIYQNNNTSVLMAQTFEGNSITPLSTEAYYRHSRARTHIKYIEQNIYRAVLGRACIEHIS